MTDARVSRGGGWVLGQSALMLGVVLASVLWRDPWYPAWACTAGWALLVMGGVIGVAGAIHLGRNRTAFPKPLPGSSLVQTGVYGWVRHPLYASVILASFGWAAAWSSGVGLVLAIVLGLFLDAKARREERWLRERYAEYAAYAKRVKRLIPLIY